MARDHRRTVSALFRLVEDLMSLDDRLREASGQADITDKYGFIASGYLDLDRMAEALTEIKSDYPTELVELLDAYGALKANDKAKRSSDLATLAWEAVLGRTTPAGVHWRAGFYGSLATASDVEKVLTIGRANLSEQLRVKRVYLCLVLQPVSVIEELAAAPARTKTAARTVIPNVYVDRRLDALGGGPLAQTIQGVNAGPIRHWAALFERAKREGKRVSDLMHGDDVVFGYLESDQDIAEIERVAETESAPNLSEGRTASGSQCPTPDVTDAVKKASTRRKPSKKK